MYFSITFGTGTTARNTWSDWHVIPDTPPIIPAPEPVRRMVDIPGRSAGPIDLSKYPTGKLTYQRISGAWTFLIDPNQDPTVRQNLYDNIRIRLHGVTDTFTLEEDTSHYYKGFFTVDPPKTGKGPLSIQIRYDLEPLRYNVSDNSVDTTWVNE